MPFKRLRLQHIVEHIITLFSGLDLLNLGDALFYGVWCSVVLDPDMPRMSAAERVDGYFYAPLIVPEDFILTIYGRHYGRLSCRRKLSSLETSVSAMLYDSDVATVVLCGRENQLIAPLRALPRL